MPNAESATFVSGGIAIFRLQSLIAVHSIKIEEMNIHFIALIYTYFQG